MLGNRTTKMTAMNTQSNIKNASRNTSNYRGVYIISYSQQGNWGRGEHPSAPSCQSRSSCRSPPGRRRVVRGCVPLAGLTTPFQDRATAYATLLPHSSGLKGIQILVMLLAMKTPTYLSTYNETQTPFHTWPKQWRPVQLRAGLVRRWCPAPVGGGGGAALGHRVIPVPHVDSFVVVAAWVPPS